MPCKTFILAFASLLVSCGLNLPPAQGNYTVTSDCPGAATSTGVLQIPDVDNVLSVFSVTNATQFGFPSDTFSYQLGGILESSAQSRSCKAQLFVKDSEYFIFLCKDNGSNVCTITGETI